MFLYEKYMLCKKNIFLLEVDTLVQSKNAFPLTSYVKENFTKKSKSKKSCVSFSIKEKLTELHIKV